MGALIFAPSSMPTPNRPLKSPPSQPVPPNKPAPRNDRMYATTSGLPGAFKRKSQLTRNNARTAPLAVPCHTPTRLALVPDGMPVQSIVPTTAASSPLMMPTSIIQKAISDQNPSPFTQWRMSKMTEVVSNPIGKLTSMRCRGCPIDLILLYILFSFSILQSSSMDSHLQTIFRAQRHQHLWLDRVTRNQAQSVTLSNRGQDQLCLHHRKTAAYAHTWSA